MLDHLDDESVILVGWSIAGQHVLLCTDEVGPDVVHAVVVVDWDIILEADRDFVANRIARVQGDRQSFTRDFVKAIHVDPEPEYVDALTEAVLTMPTNAVAMSTANWYFFGPHDLGPVVDRLNRPILLVFSALDWAKAAAQEVRESWPRLPVKVIDNTSHALFVDQPEVFNQVLANFIASLPE